MDKRKDSLSILKLCRFCLSQDGSLTTLYDRTRAPKNSVNLPLKILSCVSIEVFPSDKMPSYICNRCKMFMEIFYEYKQICRQADETILQHIQNGTSLEPVVWPPLLVKTFRYTAKSSPEFGLLKTEDGATVEVTSQDISDSEDEGDESVYNIKIEDGSDEGSKSGAACIKVVASGDKAKMSKEKPTHDHKGFSSVSKLTRHVRSHAGERAYPCKYCNKSFIKSHHYTRHLRVKHRETIRTAHGPFGEIDQYRCEQCEDSFGTQDELIYHSAVHATQDLTCPLCQEKFPDVDAVTAHIKTHVNGVEFMCDFCELVFTTQEKLDTHLSMTHAEEMRQEQEMQMEESSTEADPEDDDDDDEINVKEEDDHMVVEIRKSDDYVLLSNSQGESEDKINNTNSEESESEVTYTELSTVDTLAMIRPVPKAFEKQPTKSAQATTKGTLGKVTDKTQTASILRKAEEIKRKAVQQIQQGSEASNVADKKEKLNNKAESSAGASDKSLRLLEKELQDLKRTNARSEIVKTPAKNVELIKNRRPQIHTSTPKLRSTEEKKSQILNRSAAAEKKQPERRVITKENKEPKESKETKSNNGSNTREEKEVKNVVKNGASDKSGAEDGVRRSTRPSKIKDYAKMIRESSQDDIDDSDDNDDEEYKETVKSSESRSKLRRVSSGKVAPPKAAPAAPAAPVAARKRGRPRRERPKEVPAKIRKEVNEVNEEDKESKPEKVKSDANKTEKSLATEKIENENKASVENSNKGNSKADDTEQKLPTSNILVSPTGQTLKKVPIKALPPGVKPLPLPMSARPIGTGELCEMQIGKKVVKVQKIVMTKAEVEAMAKKGLVEMKDGTMVLKQGIKIPTSDPVAIKSTLVGEGEVSKESPSKTDKATPTRCDLGEDS